MKIRYLGHSSFSIHTQGKALVIDPFITQNPLAGNIDIDSLDADYILITHGHGDHTGDVSTIANRTGASVISNFEIVNWFGNQGINGHPLNHGGKWDFDFGTVKYVQAVHTSSLPDGSYGGQPGGFVIWNDEACIYIAGDTALTMDMKLIPDTCPKLTYAILPIGDNFTMGYEDAAIAAEFLYCEKVIGCHYDTFDLIRIDHQKAVHTFAKKGVELTLMDIGETIEV